MIVERFNTDDPNILLISRNLTYKFTILAILLIIGFFMYNNFKD